MITREFETPFAKLNVYKNGQPIDFKIVPFSYGIPLDDNSYKIPEGLYRVIIDMDSLKIGNVLVCEFDRGCLQNDGGSEHTVNIVGTIDGYTVGMGTFDTDDFGSPKDEDYGIPYELWDWTKRGFEVRIIDDPKKYKNKGYYQQIYFDIAYEPGTTDEASELISFVTDGAHGFWGNSTEYIRL
ncbi:MAG: hypothetical protein ACOYJS_00270 [Acutalibacteraceae bacterium]|jgi:hypothetical protein